MGNNNTIIKKSKFKVIFIGNPGVGKTSIINARVYNTFSQRRVPTTEVKESHCVIPIQDDYHVILEILDAPGELQPTAYRADFFRNVDAIVLTYDLTNKESFDFIKDMVGGLQNYCRKPLEDIVLVIAGNKGDLPILELKVDLNEADRLAEQCGAIHFKTSAKSTSNIRVLFDTIGLKSNIYFNRLNAQVVEEGVGGEEEDAD